MNKAITRASESGINMDIAALTITNRELMNAIAEEVDLETITNQKLREIFFIVRKQLQHLNWKELVTYSINHLPFGLDQTQIAWEGHYPCIDCPDAMVDGDQCYHKHACKAWEIYEGQL